MAAIDSMRVPNDMSLDKRAIIFYIARKEISIFISTQQKIAPMWPPRLMGPKSDKRSLVQLDICC